MMGNYIRKIAIFTLFVSLAGAVPAFLATRAEARDPRPRVALPEDYVVGGEPGEDPHLKTIPTIYVVQQSAPLEAVGDGGIVLLEECSIQPEGLREGSGRILGSRVNRVWRVFLRSWLLQMHR